jgi:hypothetical protein
VVILVELSDSFIAKPITVCCPLPALSMFAGLKYAGSRNGDAQELLYAYAVHFLNEVCMSPVK